jgi:hypothetical protein
MKYSNPVISESHKLPIHESIKEAVTYASNRFRESFGLSGRVCINDVSNLENQIFSINSKCEFFDQICTTDIIADIRAVEDAEIYVYQCRIKHIKGNLLIKFS